VRRTIAGPIIFLTFTATFLVLPVHAAPVTDARPVETSTEEISLGSVTEPADAAVVTTDGEVQPEGVTEDEASATPSPNTAPSAEAPKPGSSEGEPAAEGVATSGEELSGVPALTVSEPDTDAFFSVGVTWRQDVDLGDVVVQLRVKDPAGAWGEWTTLEADDIEQTVSKETEGNDVRGGTAPYWTGESHGIEVIVQGADGRAPEGVEVVLIDPGTSPADVAATATASGPQDQAHAAALMPSIVTRAQWGADESIRTWDPEYAPAIKAATIHHTADSNGYSAEQVPAIMRSIYAYHAQTRGWGDIGYNMIVDKFGRVFEGRYGGLASAVVGAHAGGFNTGTFGVSMLGNYAVTDTPQAMLDAVAAVIAWKLSLYALDPFGTTQLTSGGGGTAKYAAGTVVTLPTVFAHRDVGSTECPGQYAYNRMGTLRNMIAGRMAVAPHSPNGDLNEVTGGVGTVSVSGWTFDPEVPTLSINVQLTVGGASALVNASANRPDVAFYFPHAGPAHGYVATLGAPPGPQTVCATALNIGAGENRPLGCRTVTVKASVPQAFLRDANTAGIADMTAGRGQVGDLVFRCDWDGNGTDTVGTFRDGVFSLYGTNNPETTPALRFGYGQAGDKPLCGDWDGDGKDTIGVWRVGSFYLRNSNTGGIADGRVIFGNHNGVVPLVGNWDGDAYDTVGVYQNASFYMANSNLWPTSDVQVRYGDGGDTPLVGDWSGLGRDSIGIWRAGTFFLTDDMYSGRGNHVVPYGAGSDRPLTGDWNGDGKDTLGVTRGF
jgi:hypothetical protein